MFCFTMQTTCLSKYNRKIKQQQVINCPEKPVYASYSKQPGAC